MKSLAGVSKHDQLEFFNSFDHILSDLDGVVWLQYKPIPGASACLNSLKKLGKQVHYVSNNSTTPVEYMQKILEASGLNTDIKDIVQPILAIIAYLKRINFNKELYVIGMNEMKKIIIKSGILVAADASDEKSESLATLTRNLEDNDNVGGVLIDIDLNLHFLRLQKALTYLKRQDCIFLAGAGDAKLPVQNTILIGPHHFINALIDISGREPHRIAKPYPSFNEFILERFEITNPERVLFIGDTINEDLNFATKCGYQKLLVLSGVTKEDDLLHWKYPEELKPQYYVENLNELNHILNDCFRLTSKI